MQYKKFGQLTAMQQVEHSRGSHIQWLCFCDCGNEVIITGSSLRRNSHKSSCSDCFKEDCTKKARDLDTWQGVGDISKSWWTNRVTRQNTRRKPKEVSVTMEYAWDVFLKQGRKCAYTKLPLTFPRTWKDIGNASLDRINSDAGYVEGNIQWVDKRVNIMKNSIPHEEFVNLCCLIAGGACEIT